MISNLQTNWKVFRLTRMDGKNRVRVEAMLDGGGSLNRIYFYTTLDKSRDEFALGEYLWSFDLKQRKGKIHNGPPL